MSMLRRSETLLKKIASAIEARLNCIKSSNSEWQPKWEAELQRLEDMLPSGSGIDSGTKIDLDRSTGEKLVLTMSFHHMDENGYYDGWTDHEVIVRSKSLFLGPDIRITGRNRNDIKDYLFQTYEYCLNEPIPYHYSNDELRAFIPAFKHRGLTHTELGDLLDVARLMADRFPLDWEGVQFTFTPNLKEQLFNHITSLIPAPQS